MEKIRLGISACLLGEKVRYDGGHKLDHYLRESVGQFVDWVPVCPEVECGLPVPREAMHLVRTPEGIRLLTRRTGIDHTQRMNDWTVKKLRQLADDELCGFVFKSRSPSSGIAGVKIYDEEGVLSGRGPGLFGGAFRERFPLLPVEDDGRLQDTSLRENFIERVFVFSRWRRFISEGGKPAALVQFHAAHKLLILAHSTKHYTLMGRLVAGAKGSEKKKLHEEYLALLMEGLSLIATRRKNTNVLMHMMGYFKKELAREEKEELLKIIEDYRMGYTPLIVPVTLIRHYVRKYHKEYLRQQYYLEPHPAELMLRNHA